MKIKNTDNQRGFTLMEMIVSIAIIATISALFLTNYHGYKTSGELNMAAQKLASDIRLAQTYALSMKEFNGAPPSGGWGVRLANDESEYIIFADRIANHKYKAGDNENFRKINLGQNIVIEKFLVDGNDNRKYLYLVYTPPEPIAYFGTANSEGNDNLIDENATQAEITMTQTSTGATKTIIVNSYGLVDVVN